MTGQFQLDEDQLAIQELARRFTADNITPQAARWDEEHIFPVDVIKRTAELGFGAIYVSDESGGIGLGRLEAALIMQAMAYGCSATSAFVSIHNMAAWIIDTFGGPELKERFLPGLATMNKLASYYLTEPGSGSDAAALKASARGIYPSSVSQPACSLSPADMIMEDSIHSTGIVCRTARVLSRYRTARCVLQRQGAARQ